MTILAIVNAEREGQIESKLIKSRQMEEIREAKRKEAEARQEKRKTKLVRKPRVFDGASAHDQHRKKPKTLSGGVESGPLMMV